MAKTYANIREMRAGIKAAREAQARAFAQSVSRTAEVGYANIQGRLRGRPGLNYQSGNLSRSVTRTVKPVSTLRLTIVFTAGGGRVKYAAIHETGGTIQGKPWLRFRIGRGKGRGKKSRGSFVTVRQVTITARPYMRPSAVEALGFLRKDLAEHIGPAIKAAL